MQPTTTSPESVATPNGTSMGRQMMQHLRNHTDHEARPETQQEKYFGTLFKVFFTKGGVTGHAYIVADEHTDPEELFAKVYGHEYRVDEVTKPDRKLSKRLRDLWAEQ